MAFPTHYDFSGIISTADQTTATLLPLDSLDVHVSLVDVSARVVLSQVYSHRGPGILTQAYYVFPVPARAAVCSFQMKVDNGFRLIGVVKELSQAKEDYQEALGKGLLAGLLEQYSQDVFVMSIGSMPPNTKVTVLLSYVVDLSEDDEIDSVRFQLSSHVRLRYGAPSNSALSRDIIHKAPLTITVDINMPGNILEATSLNHKPFIDSPVPATQSLAAHHSRHFARKRFSSALFDLQADFVLTVRAYGLGRPRCFAESLSRDPEDGPSRSAVGPTTALALTLVPQFDLNIRPVQEYIFVVDRSGSMGASLGTGADGISIAKQSLHLLLEQLKLLTNSMFNIYSFGSTFYPMWHQSQLFTDAIVQDARREVDLMQANLGGTDLYAALNGVLLSRRKDIPTCIFVLTDGEINNYMAHMTFQAVQNAVSQASVNAPLRVFTLGMGSGVSTWLCQELARLGNGSCLLAVEGEPLAFKATQLVKAMQTPQVRHMSIDWGHGVIDQVRQAPCRIGALSAGMRLLITALIQGDHVPAAVTLRVNLQDGTTFNYDVPVELVSDHIPDTLSKALGRTIDIPPLIHTIAAHLLIQDLEGGLTQPPELQGLVAPSPETRRNIIKRAIVELGTQYQIASSRTAFVAVEATAPSKSRNQGNRNRRNSRSGSSCHSTSQSGSSTTTSQNRKSGSKSRTGRTNGTHSNQSNTNRNSNKKNSTASGGNSPSTTGRTNGTHDSQSNTNRNSNTKKSTASGGNPPSTTSKSSQGYSTRCGANNQAYGDVEKSNATSPKTQQNSSSTETTPSQSSTSPSNSETTTQSESPTNKMPGAFKSSGNAGTTMPGLFDFFTHKPSPETVLVEEVVCVPDPQGGSPTIFTAPPRPFYTTVTTMMKSLWSFVFSKNPSGAPKVNSHKLPPSVKKALFPEEILKISRLQSPDGSFPSLSNLSLVVGISDLQLRSSAPSMEYGDNNESIWATAIAIAFFEKRLFEHIALWEDKANNAKKFGSMVCGSEEKFNEIVEKALKLF